jgi:mono/diheme cytochrome c family protein
MKEVPSAALQIVGLFWSAPVLRRFQKGAERQEQTEWSRSALFKSAGGQAHSKTGFQPVSPRLRGMFGLRLSPALAAICALLVLAGCQREMRVDARIQVQQPSEFFANHSSARPLIAGTVPQEKTIGDAFFETGEINGHLVIGFPQAVTQDQLQRGRERYTIYCSECHGLSGDGDGMIVQRGFPPPPSFHEARLVGAPEGHFFSVITHGYGVMYAYGDRVSESDRWAIIAYIRALQLSRTVKVDALPPEQQRELTTKPGG